MATAAVWLKHQKMCSSKPHGRRDVDMTNTELSLYEQWRYSVEEIIRGHLKQDVDRDNAIMEASREIARAAFRLMKQNTTLAARVAEGRDHDD